MATRNSSQYFTPLDLDGDEPLEAFFTGERVCAPSGERRTERSSWGSSFLVITVLMAAGLSVLKLPADWRAAVYAQGRALIELAFAPRIEEMPRVEQIAVKPEPLPQQEIKTATGAEAGTPVPEAKPAAEPETAEASPEVATADEKPQPLPPPVADPSDPLQKRALAAGLHPDLSRAVLARFSEADWKNASHAVSAALGQKSVKDVFTWPKEPKPKNAQFEVRFVAAAGADCRRYVVTVIKDRWSTTAPAMETCGGESAHGKGA